jgi:hypothetical protein
LEIFALQDLIVDGSIDDQLFSDQTQLDLFVRWLQKFMLIETKQRKLFDREKKKQNCFVKDKKNNSQL